MAISDKKKASNARYIKKCDAINIRPIKDKGDLIRKAAASAGESLQGYVLKAIDQRMERDATTPIDPAKK